MLTDILSDFKLYSSCINFKFLSLAVTFAMTRQLKLNKNTHVAIFNVDFPTFDQLIRGMINIAGVSRNYLLKDEGKILRSFQ